MLAISLGCWIYFNFPYLLCLLRRFSFLFEFWPQYDPANIFTCSRKGKESYFHSSGSDWLYIMILQAFSRWYIPFDLCNLYFYLFLYVDLIIFLCGSTNSFKLGAMYGHFFLFVYVDLIIYLGITDFKLVLCMDTQNFTRCYDWFHIYMPVQQRFLS